MLAATAQALLHRLDLELPLAHVLEVLGRPEEHVDQCADEGRDQPEHGRRAHEPWIFDPPPRVDSAVVRMVPRSQPAAVDEKLLSELVQVAFSQRRKLLRHTLGKWLEQKNFSGAFDTQRRAEEVPVDDYLELAKAVSGAQPAK